MRAHDGEHHEGHEGQGTHGQKTGHRDPAQEQHPQGRGDQHHHGAVVGLDVQECPDDRQNGDRAEEAGGGGPYRPGVAIDETGEVQDGQDLGQLGGLEGHRADAQPAHGAVALDPKARDEHRREQRDGQEQCEGAELAQDPGRVRRPA